MTRLRATWLDDPRTAAVTSALEGGGHLALFVGGCVRNALIGAAETDVDIATDARPPRVAALAGAAGLKAVPTGVEHGTMTVVSGGLPVEVTTFRRDVATDGRRAVVAFGDDVATDAARRDFTMNALYARPDGTVLDPLGSGLADLSARRLRFVGDPARRIAEDRLRVLRLFRFHAWYGAPAAHDGAPAAHDGAPAGGLDPEALAAAAAASGALGELSRERVGAEIVKLLLAPDPAPAVEAMAGAGVLAAVLPGAEAGRLAPLVRAEALAGAAPRWQRRLAALGPVEGRAAALRLSRAEARALEAVAAAQAAGGDPAVLAYLHGADAARDAALLAAAAAGAAPPEGLEAALARGAAARFPLRAADLEGLEGPALGAALRRLEAAWVASGFALDRAALLGIGGGALRSG